MEHFKLKPYVHRASTTLDQRALTYTFEKLRDKRNNKSKRNQWILSSENGKHTNMFSNTDNALSCFYLYFHVKWRKARHCDARTVCFEAGLGKPILTLNDSGRWLARIANES